MKEEMELDVLLEKFVKEQTELLSDISDEKFELGYNNLMKVRNAIDSLLNEKWCKKRMEFLSCKNNIRKRENK